MLGAIEEFSEEQRALLPQPPEAGAGEPGEKKGGEQPSAAPAPAADSTTPAAAPAAAAPSPEAPTAPAPPPTGDVRAALRASRRAEHGWREKAQRLEREVDELRKKVPADTSHVLTDEELAEAKEFAENPVVGKLLKIAEKAASAPAPAPAAEPQETGFQPEPLSPEVQEVVDDIPELLAWQNDPAKQKLWAAAKAEDTYLRMHTAWADAPLADRLAEVVLRVKADAGITTSPPNAAAPAAAPVQAPAVAPMTLSDMPGGGGDQPGPSRLARYQSMTQEQIFDELARGC